MCVCVSAVCACVPECVSYLIYLITTNAIRPQQRAVLWSGGDKARHTERSGVVIADRGAEKSWIHLREKKFEKTEKSDPYNIHILYVYIIDRFDSE